MQNTEPAVSRKLLELKANPAWVSIRLRLVVHALDLRDEKYKPREFANDAERRAAVAEKDRYLVEIEEHVHTALAEFVEAHGADLDAFGGLNKAVKEMARLFDNSLSRFRRSHDRIRGSFELSDVLLARYCGRPTDPESLLLADGKRHDVERFWQRMEELAAPHPCSKLLIEAFQRADPDPTAVARAAGFTQDDVNNERKRLKRLAQQAAEELEIEPESADDARSTEESSP